MFGYVYITKNLVNGRMYIGKSESPVYNPKYLGSGTIVSQAIDKYGSQSFVNRMIYECPISPSMSLDEHKEKLKRMEKFVIALLDAVVDPLFYNLTPGGDGLSRGSKRANPVTDETRRRISEANLGSKRTDTQKANMSVAAHRKFASGFVHPMLGKSHTAESSAKMSASRLGKIQSTESNEKRKKAMSGKPKQIVDCPHCGVSGGKPVMTRYHFDNCKRLSFSASSC